MSTDAIRSKEKILVVRRIMLSLYQHLVCFVDNFILLCICYRVSCSVVLVLVSYKLVYVVFNKIFKIVSRVFLSFLLSR